MSKKPKRFYVSDLIYKKNSEQNTYIHKMKNIIITLLKIKRKNYQALICRYRLYNKRTESTFAFDIIYNLKKQIPRIVIRSAEVI